MADNNARIVPGHGPLGNKADLTKSRDMLVVARVRVQELKAAGKIRGRNSGEQTFGRFGFCMERHARQRNLRADDLFIAFDLHPVGDLDHCLALVFSRFLAVKVSWLAQRPTLTTFWRSARPTDGAQNVCIALPERYIE